MANIMAKIVMFSILLNLAAGITMMAAVDADGNKIFDRTSTSGFYSNNTDEYSDTFQTELEKSIQPAGSIDDKGDQIYRVLDMMSLGFIYRFVKVVDNYMFGFIDILDSIIGPFLATDVRSKLFGTGGGFGVFKIMLTISYILMGIKLFTGKDVVEDS